MTRQPSYIPDIFIVGAPKCGTSSLHNWLSAHPQIVGSMPKETFYLMEEGHPLKNKKNSFAEEGWAGYRHFFPAETGSAMRLESSTHYLYQRHLPGLLQSAKNEATIIVVLRKPSQRIYSSFKYSANNLAAFKRQISFNQYVDMLISGNESDLDKLIDRPASLYTLRNELAYSDYGPFLENWKSTFGSEALRILLFEDIMADPLLHVSRLAESIGLDASFYESFNFFDKNRTVAIKNTGLHRQALWFNQTFRLPDKVKDILKAGYAAFQVGKKKDLSEDDRAGLAKLDAYFAPIEGRLSAQFNLDISPW